MSYSFTVRAATKAQAKVEVARMFDEVVVRNQDCHKRDQVQALAAADAFIDLLSDEDGKDVVVNMAGSLTGTWQGSDVTRIGGANLSVTASLAGRPTETA